MRSRIWPWSYCWGLCILSLVAGPWAADALSLPTKIDPKTGEGVLWTAELGSEAYGGPTVAGGMVFVGTNNDRPRDPAVEGDHGILMAFRAADGSFLWQASHPKLASGAINDWPHQGVGSTPAVEGDRLYYITNRAELLALDVEGFHDGENDGPYQGESATGTEQADIVWRLDMIEALGVFPHHLAASSPLVVGDRLFVVTGHGVDEKQQVRRPEAPSFLAVDRHKGEVLWMASSPGANILDGQWGSPAHGRLGGRDQVVFPGGDGWVYAFDPASGKELWRFDASSHLVAAKEGEKAPRENLIADPVIHQGRVYVTTGHDPELGAGIGRLWALRGDGAGDITPSGDTNGEGSAVAWAHSGESFSRVLGTPVLDDGLLYVSDLNGFLHCLEASTGEYLWEHDTFAAVWSGPLVAEGKIYQGDEDGDLAILTAGRTPELLAEVYLGGSIQATPVAADGVLYVATRGKLWALTENAGAEVEASEKDRPTGGETSEEEGRDSPPENT